MTTPPSRNLPGALSADPGVAVAIPFPMAPDATVTAVQVIPTTSPQAAETEELLVRIRGEVIPPVAQATGLTALVGGTLAITSDFTTVLTDALPLFLLVVIGFGFLALVLLFRSILVPLTGVVTSLLSLAAAMGVTVAVFQWGWLAELIGVTRTGPIMPFLPIMVFAILFGLSMDYQVFLVSRMQEEWGHTADNDKAVRRGLAASGRVVMIAAAIMISVFARVRPGQRADDQAVRPGTGHGRAVRRVRHPADHRALGDVPAGQRELVAPGVDGSNPAQRRCRVRGGRHLRGRRDRRHPRRGSAHPERALTALR